MLPVFSILLNGLVQLAVHLLQSSEYFLFLALLFPFFLGKHFRKLLNLRTELSIYLLSDIFCAIFLPLDFGLKWIQLHFQVGELFHSIFASRVALRFSRGELDKEAFQGNIYFLLRVLALLYICMHKYFHHFLYRSLVDLLSPGYFNFRLLFYLWLIGYKVFHFLPIVIWVGLQFSSSNRLFIWSWSCSALLLDNTLAKSSVPIIGYELV